MSPMTHGEIEKYKDFWLPWLDVAQQYLAQNNINMVYEWSEVNARLEFMTNFEHDEKEYLTVTWCQWWKSPEVLKKIANLYIQRIVYEANLKRKTIV